MQFFFLLLLFSHYPAGDAWLLCGNASPITVKLKSSHTFNRNRYMCMCDFISVVARSEVAFSEEQQVPGSLFLFYQVFETSARIISTFSLCHL